MENINKDEYSIRLQKLKKIIEAKIEPYPAKSTLNSTIAEASDKELGTGGIKVAGRLMTIRLIGKLIFANLADQSGKIQISLKHDEIGKDIFDQFVKFIDVGDYIGVEGELFKTHKGEITIAVKKFTLLTKSLRPLPEKWHGLKDQEIRYRQRYLDLIANPEVKKIFLKRAELIKNIRQYFDQRDFIEVETPVLEKIPGGADAEPFITHHNTLDVDFYLRISLELHLKRLVVGGLEKVYEIGKVFRNEGISTEHLQEFTLLEFYWAYASYLELMNLIEDFYTTIIKNTFGSLQVKYQNNILDFKAAWPKVDYREALKKETGIDVVKSSDKDIIKVLKAKHIETEKSASRGRLIDQLYKKTVRPKLVHPCFLINHPVAVSPLAKRQSQEPELTQRFQVLIAGSEVGNGFSELNDPLDQKARFEEQTKFRAAGDKEAQMMDEDFVCALEHGMPPTAGFGVGIDRLLMILTNQPSIRDVVLFPMMRPEK